jgi:hypothetical protein
MFGRCGDDENGGEIRLMIKSTGDISKNVYTNILEGFNG